ncbi:MAG: LamG-like jellyroll fold domain-containing protein, partial [Planctomycetota bacterium]
MARLFDDVNQDYLSRDSVSGLPSGGAFTMVIWINPDALPTASNLHAYYQLRENNTRFYAIALNSSGNAVFQTRRGSIQNVTSTNSISANSGWHCVIAGVDASNNQFVYLDNAGRASTARPAIPPIPNGVRVGAANAGASAASGHIGPFFTLSGFDGDASTAADFRQAVSDGVSPMWFLGPSAVNVLVASELWGITFGGAGGGEPGLGNSIFAINGSPTLSDSPPQYITFYTSWVPFPPAVTEQVISVGLSTETDTAFAVQPERTYPLGQAVETDTAFAIQPERTYPLGQAVETDTAFAIQPERIYPLGQAVETDTAFGLILEQKIAVNQAVETDTAFAITEVLTLDIAIETDTAFAVQPERTYPLG